MNGINIGDIFVHSWGYDQTNIDFYQVVRKTLNSVIVSPIASNPVSNSEGVMSNRVMPIKDEFVIKHTALNDKQINTDGIKQIRKVVKEQGSTYYLPTRFGWCSLWDGKPQYQSWYH